MSVVDTRFGHTEGRVCLAYNEKNNKVIIISHSYCHTSSIFCLKIVSVGSDGEMRVWSGNVPQTTLIISYDPVLTILVKVLTMTTARTR